MAGFSIPPAERMPSYDDIAERYARGMGAPNFELIWLLYVTAILLASILTLLTIYWLLRLAIFHGMRAHTRWIEDGGDRA